MISAPRYPSLLQGHTGPWCPTWSRSSGPRTSCTARDEMLVYECDGYVVEKSVPDVVVFPTSTEQVVEVVKLCNRHDIPFVPRGAGTSLAGGTLTIGGGVMICLTRMKRILEVSIRDRYAIVESGVVNVWLTRSLAGHRVPLRPRPVEPGGLHDRRQRRDQLGRAAHAQVRRDRQPHQGGDARHARRHGRRDRRDHRGQPRLRPDRPGRRQRGDLRHRHQGGRQPDARPRGGPDPPGASSTRSTRPPRPSAGSSPRGSCRPRSRCSTT